MSDFNENQIEDAKRRVNEMRKRANSYTNSQSDSNNIETKDDENIHNHNTNLMNQQFSIDGILKSLGLGNNDENSKGSGLILALILVLSYEKADSMLILALLYILL